jgi:hypothetical protein
MNIYLKIQIHVHVGLFENNSDELSGFSARPTPDQLQTNSRPTPDQLRTNSRPTPDQLQTTPDQLGTNSGPTPDQLQTNSRPTPDQLQTTNGRSYWLIYVVKEQKRTC